MKLKSAHVKNFRVLKDMNVSFEDEISLIIGKNNSGKTSFFSILQKFLLSNNAEFSFEDFSIEYQKEILALEKKELKPEEFEEIALSLKLFIEYQADENIGMASKILLDLDDKKHMLVMLFEYSMNYEKYQKLVFDYKIYHKKIKRDFTYYISKNINRYFSVQVKALEYENESNYKEINNDVVKSVISLQTIGAKRDVENQQGHSKSLSQLAGKYYNQNVLSDLEFPELQEQLRETDDNLTETYKALFSPVIEEIRTMSYNPSEAGISILSSLSEKKIFQENTIVKYQHDDTLLPEDYNGLGFLNLFAIIFSIRIKLDQLSKKNKTDENPTPINLLFIEEPEAHTHPQMQYIFIKNIKKILNKHCGENIFSLQTIISTHSSHIVSQCDFEDIKYFFRENSKSVKCRNLKDLHSCMSFWEYSTPDTESKELSEEEQKSIDDEKKISQEKNFRFLKQYITLQRSELFFADKVILIEGDTERLLFSAMMKKFDNEKISLETKDYVPLSSQNISIVEVGAYSHIFATFLAFLGIRTLIITDLDTAKKEEKISEKTRKKYTCETKCCPSEATVTTNASIKFFVKTKILKDILKFDSDKLTLEYKESSWGCDKSGKLRLAFQIIENGYQPSSFEDAFISLNFQFIKKNMDSFIGLKNRKLLEAVSGNYYEIANKCIDSKTSFALDIILNGGENYEEWEIPLYIKEGFEWLIL